MQEHREAVSFQQRFARSDDIAAVLAGQSDQAVRVDASGIGLGALLELLMLKRGAHQAVTVADTSSRGRLLRRLLKSSQTYLSEGARGVLHRRAGHESEAATNDFADSFRAQLVAAGVVTTAALRLSGALHELLTNVDEHAGDGVDGLGAFEVLEREAWMVVADSGRGVLGGYQVSPLADKPADAEQALKWAVIDHRSRTGEPDRGTRTARSPTFPCTPVPARAPPPRFHGPRASGPARQPRRGQPDARSIGRRSAWWQCR